MKLRWYQEQAVAAVWDYLRTNKDGAPCVVLPTGSGKTPVIAELCRQVVEWGGRAIALAHVKELLEQSVDKLSKFVDPSLVGVYSAGLGERTTSTPIVVAGIQSVYTKAEELGAFQLIVVDEAHLIPPTGSGRYRQFLEAERKISPQARLVGLTATPYRTGCGWITRDRAEDDESQTGYDRLLDAIVYEVPTDQLIADGTLSAVVSKTARRSPDFSNVHTIRGDYNEQEIEQVLSKKGALESICSEIVEKTADRKKVLVFCNLRESARRCAKILSEYASEYETAVVDGDTSANERADLVRRFKNEKGDFDLFGNESKPLKYICNVGVFTTGFDAPNVDCVALVRPTQSLVLYQQMVGRGLRRSPDKYDCLILDFGGNINRHGPIDLPKPQANKGDALWKECKKCGAVVARFHQVCPICGEPFSVPKPPQERDSRSGLESRASSSAILSNQQEETSVSVEVDECDVLKIEYSTHYKKDSDKPPTLQVKYVRGQFRRPVFEWLCPEHSGFARKRFEKWWKSKSKVDPPTTAEQAAEWANDGALATPKRIRTTLKFGEWFPTIEWLDVEPLPDFDPNADHTGLDKFLDDDDKEELGYSEFNEWSEPDGRFELPLGEQGAESRCDSTATNACGCSNCDHFGDLETDGSGVCSVRNMWCNKSHGACEDWTPLVLDDLPF